jgi:hypothetical protein
MSDSINSINFEAQILNMSRKFVDLSVVHRRNMGKEGNIDNGFWHNKSISQRLEAAITMIQAAYQDTNFVKGKVNRQLISMRKQA